MKLRLMLSSRQDSVCSTLLACACPSCAECQGRQGDHTDANVVIRLPKPPLSTWALQASCGGTHTTVLSSEGRIFVWGRGSFGRLGSGTEKDHYSPVEVFLPGRGPPVACTGSMSAARVWQHGGVHERE